MPSIDKLRHNIRHAVSLSAFSPNLIHRIRYFFLYTVTFRDYSLITKLLYRDLCRNCCIRASFLYIYASAFRTAFLNFQIFLHVVEYKNI